MVDGVVVIDHYNQNYMQKESRELEKSCFSHDGISFLFKFVI